MGSDICLIWYWYYNAVYRTKILLPCWVEHLYLVASIVMILDAGLQSGKMIFVHELKK